MGMMQKKALLSVAVFAAFFLLLTGIGLLMPDKTVSYQTVMIHAPQGTIVSQIADLNNWKNWHPYFMQSATMKVRDAASAEWSANGSAYRLQITKINPGGVAFDIVENGKRRIGNSIEVQQIKDSMGFQTQWYSAMPVRWYPWEKLGALFLSKMGNPGNRAALESLKSYCENRR